MKTTSVRLADGCRLTYFDAGTGPRRDFADHRRIARVPDPSELRWDPIAGEWVIVAAHRQDRTYQPAATDCPLCPSREGNLTEVPAPDYDVVVFENRFPALSAVEGPGPFPGDPHGPFRTRRGFGFCEVVSFTPEHAGSFADLAPGQAGLVVDALAERTRDLSARPGIEQVFCFENRGQDIGVTLDHPHGQIYAYPFVTPRTERMIRMASAHRQDTGRNLFEDVLHAERASGTRIVAETPEWTAFVPHAARWPYEVHVYPTRRVPDLTGLSDTQKCQFVDIYLDLLHRFDRLFDDPTPYISAWHQAPVHQGRDEFALHLQLFTVRRSSDRLKYLAGSESGMGAFTNDIGPEAAAERLRALTARTS